MSHLLLFSLIIAAADLAFFLTNSRGTAVTFAGSFVLGCCTATFVISILQHRHAAKLAEFVRQGERTRLARDLHDSIKQQIFSIRVGVATVLQRWDSDPAGAMNAVGDIRANADEAMVEMEALLHHLHPIPLTISGLVDSIGKQCEALGYRIGAEVRVELDKVPDDREMIHGTHQAVFRIAQESLSNVAKHSRARNVAVKLGAESGELVLNISDDGCGFEPATVRRSLGMLGMSERAASVGANLSVGPGPDGGTVVRLSVPMLPGSAEALASQVRERLESALFAGLLAAGLIWAGTRLHVDVRQPFLYGALPIALAAATFSAIQSRKVQRQYETVPIAQRVVFQTRAFLWLAAMFANAWYWRLAIEPWTTERSVLLAFAAFCALGGAVNFVRLHRAWRKQRATESHEAFRESARTAWRACVTFVAVTFLVLGSLSLLLPDVGTAAAGLMIITWFFYVEAWTNHLEAR